MTDSSIPPWLQAEWDAIKVRAPDLDAPRQLAGIALSGGGIRSASVCLGVLQALDAGGQLGRFHYLSSVSGGGYIGIGWLARAAGEYEAKRACGKPLPSPAAMRFPYQPPEAAPPDSSHPSKDRKPKLRPLGWLRDRASYLLAPGAGPILAAFGMLARKLIANLLTILPMLLLAAVLVAILGEAEARIGGWLAGKVSVTMACLAAGLLLLAGILRSGFLERAAAGSSAEAGARTRASLDQWGAKVLLASIALVLSGAPYWLQELGGLLRDAESGRLAVPALAAVAGSLVLGMVAGRVRGRAGLPILAILGAVFIGGLIMLLAWLGDWLPDPMKGASLARLLPGIAAYSPSPLPVAAGLALLALGGLAGGILWFRPWGFPAWRRHAADRAIPALLALCGIAVLVPGADAAELDWAAVLVAAIVAPLSLLLVWRLVDPNTTSLHGFYRDRLADAFLGHPSGLSPGLPRPIRMSDLTPAKTGGPFPILNATVNGAPSSELARRGRRAAPLTVTPLEAGNITLNYCRTEALERAAPDFDAAAAIALSGAALSPNSGSRSQGALATFVKGLLNVRTGRWLPAPRFARAGRPPKPRLGPQQFLLELTGIRRNTPEDRWIFVSDGGHFENLGLISLLYRRCALILVVDAEADPRMTFNGVGVAARIARLDLGAELELDLSALCPDVDRRSHGHVVEGTVRYAADDPVWPHGVARVIYLKSSVTGDEPPDLLEYRSRYPAFPQETTADQFFSEEQFEAYRKLGAHMATEVLDRAARNPWLGEPR